MQGYRSLKFILPTLVIKTDRWSVIGQLVAKAINHVFIASKNAQKHRQLFKID